MDKSQIKRIYFLSCLFLVIILLLSGCSSENGESSSAVETEEEVTIETSEEDVTIGTDEVETSSQGNEQQIVLGAEQEGLNFLQELWVELVGHEVAWCDGELETLFNGTTGTFYTRDICMPWTTEEMFSEAPVNVFDRESKLRYTGLLSLDQGKLQYERKDGRGEEYSNTKYNKIVEQSNLFIQAYVKLSLIGDPLDKETAGYADRCKVAELLLDAGLHYAAEQFLEEGKLFSGAASAEEELASSMEVLMYVAQNSGDLDLPSGEVIVLLGDGQKRAIRVNYKGSCREQTADYTVEEVDVQKTMAAMTDALYLDATLTMSCKQAWMYGTWQEMKEYDSATHYRGEYGTFYRLDEDYDGDGENDWMLSVPFGSSAVRMYVVMSGGEALYVTHTRKESFEEGVVPKLIAADVDGDGINDLLEVSPVQDGDTAIERIIVFRKTEAGWFYDAFGYPSKSAGYGYQVIELKLTVTRMDDEHVKIYHANSGANGILAVTAAQMEQLGLSEEKTEVIYDFIGETISVTHDSLAGKDILVITNLREEDAPEITCEMEYVGKSEWKIRGFH